MILHVTLKVGNVGSMQFQIDTKTMDATYALTTNSDFNNYRSEVREREWGDMKNAIGLLDELKEAIEGILKEHLEKGE
jgi:hypothetical protein